MKVPSSIPPDEVNFADAASPQLIRKLRLAVAPPGMKGLWLRHMSDSQLVESFFMLEAGETDYGVAKKAQAEWGLMGASQVKSLARGVKSFRDRTLSEIVKARTSGVDEKTIQKIEKRVKKIEEDVDAMEIQAWAILRMQDRVITLLSKEAKSMPLKITNACFEILAKLIDQYLRWQVELGRVPCTPAELNLNVSHKFAGLLAHTIGGDSEKIVHATERFMEEIDKRALTLKMGNDGTYKFQKKEIESESAGCEYFSNPS